MNLPRGCIAAALLLAGCDQSGQVISPSVQTSDLVLQASEYDGNPKLTSALDPVNASQADHKEAIRALGGHYKTSKERVNFSGSRISDSDLEYVACMLSVRSIDLNWTPTTDAGLAHLSGLTHLRDIRLAGTQITDAGLQQLAALRRLDSIQLSDTQVTDAVLDVLSQFPALRSVDLANTQLTTASLDRLKQMNEFRTLSISEDLFSDAEIEELKQALPNIRIVLKEPSAADRVAARESRS